MLTILQDFPIRYRRFYAGEVVAPELVGPEPSREALSVAGYVDPSPAPEAPAEDENIDPGEEPAE